MKILIFTINPLHNAPRVVREINALKQDFDIVATGITAPHDASIDFIDAHPFRLSHFEYTLGKIFRVLFMGKVFLGKYFSTQLKIDKLLKETNPDIVIVHPGAFLPYFFKKEKKYKIVFNAHEFHPKEFEGDLRWKKTWGKIYHSIYRRYLPKVDLMINVCDGIAEECASIYGRASIVIPNAGPYFPLMKPNPVTSGKIKMIHHGVAISARKLELMIELVGRLGDGYELDMMLVYEDEAYYNQLQSLAIKQGNVRLIPPVGFEEIIPFINRYDIGLFLLPPVNFNYLHALPNKFFEFIQARLAIAVGPSPEMAGLVKKFKLGIVSEDFTVESMIDRFSNISYSEINEFKNNSDKAAAKINAQQYDKLFLSCIQNIFN